MAVPLGRDYLRNLRVAAAVLALACLAAMALFIREISRQREERPVVSIAGFATGPVRWQPTVYSYNEAKSALICEADERGERTLRVRLDDVDGTSYLGVGFTGPFKVPTDAELVLDWKRRGTSPGIEFHLVDAEAGRKGEVFSTQIPLIGEDWTVSRIPLSAFSRNAFQDAGRPSDGQLNPDGIQAVEIGFPLGTRMDVVVRSIGFVWGDTLDASVFVFPPLVAVGLLLILRSFSLATLTATARIITARLTNRYVLACVTTAALLEFAGARRGLGTTELAALAGFAALVLLDEAWAHPLQGTPAWAWRVMAFLGLAVWGGLSPTPLQYGLLCVAAIAPAFERPGWRLLAVFSALALGLVVVMRPLAPLTARLPQLAGACVAVLLLFLLALYLHGRQQMQITARTLQLYDGIFHESSECIYTLDAQGSVTSVNPGFERLLGRPAKELLGTRLDAFLVEEDRERVMAALNPDASHASTDLRFVDATGRVRYTLTRIQPVVGGDTAAGFQVISTDISERRLLEEELVKANRELQALSERDDLTALFNRRCFDRHMGQEFARARRSHTPLALVLCDIDYFKGYNDTVGHQGGDDVLRAVGLLLSGFARRAGEMAARYGGDEFALILPGSDGTSLGYICERLRAAVETAELPHPQSAISTFLTLSIGAASIQPSADCKPEDLIATADRALYQAKERGRNRVALLTDLVRAGVSLRRA